MCSLLDFASPSSDINHIATLEWLQQNAKDLVYQCLQPHQSGDPNLSLTQILFTQYINFRYAIRWEDGPQVIRHWELWHPRFLGTGCKNYSVESVELLSNIHANFPQSYCLHCITGQSTWRENPVMGISSTSRWSTLTCKLSTYKISTFN